MIITKYIYRLFNNVLRQDDYSINGLHRPTQNSPKVQEPVTRFQGTSCSICLRQAHFDNDHAVFASKGFYPIRPGVFSNTGTQGGEVKISRLAICPPPPDRVKAGINCS